MKRMSVVLAAVLSLALAPLAASAQNNAATPPPSKGMPGPQARMAGPGPMPMAMMMGAMAGRVMVATRDGGVVVLAGEKLMKFDKNLKLVKEVEVKIDTAAMERWMEQMTNRYGQCPMGRWKRGGARGRMMAPQK